MKIKQVHIIVSLLLFLSIGLGSCNNSADFNGTYTSTLCPYFGFTTLNPQIKIYLEGGKQFIEFNGATYVGEMEGKKLNFFSSPDNIPYSLEKNEKGQYVLNPYKCIYSKN